MQWSFLGLLVLCERVSAMFMTPNVLNTSVLEFHHGRKMTPYPLYEASQLLKNPNFNKSWPTVMFLDGYQDKMIFRFRRMFVSAYKQRGEHNVIIVNWDKIAGGNYVLEAFPNTIMFGTVLADAFLEMTRNGFNLSSLHITGQSLGAQLCSFVGRSVIERSKGKHKLKRITGLDPAFPLFYPGLIGGHLSHKDAVMVDVIHSDGFIYGTPFKTGTVDFWPNGGRLRQPGCPPRSFRLLSVQDLCAHWRATEYFLESVRQGKEKTFQAMKCKSWDAFQRGECKGQPVSMGFDCPHGVRGDYFLQTNEVAPFSRGMRGTRYA